MVEKKLIEINNKNNFFTSSCNCCSSKKDVRAISFNAKDSNYRTIVALCKECLKKLKIEIEENLKLEELKGE